MKIIQKDRTPSLSEKTERHHLLSKQNPSKEVGIQGGLEHFSFGAHSALHRGRAKERQGYFSKDIEVFRGMVHANRGRILPENHIQHPIQLVLD